MTYTFDTSILVSQNAKKYVDKALLSDLTILLSSAEVNTTKEYNDLVKKIVNLLRKYPITSGNSPIHKTEIPLIHNHKPLTEETPWGGVALKKVDVEKDFIQKLLVINKYGILGFEIHKKKHEKLKVLEGVVLMLYSNHKSPRWQEGKVSVTITTFGDTADLPPYDEHGMIALTDSVVEETSTNHLDDLVFIFQSVQHNS